MVTKNFGNYKERIAKFQLTIVLRISKNSKFLLFLENQIKLLWKIFPLYGFKDFNFLLSAEEIESKSNILNTQPPWHPISNETSFHLVKYSFFNIPGANR